MLVVVKSFQQWRADLARTDSVIRMWTDHKALEYFITTKQLNQRQTRWAEVLTEFYFIIAYRPGKQNKLANTLIYREQNLQTQNNTKVASYIQVLLSEENLDSCISVDLSSSLEIAPIKGITSIELVDQLLQVNWENNELELSRDKAKSRDQDYFIQDGLLLFCHRLVIPDKNDLFHTKLIQKVHSQVVSAHPGKSKTITLLA